MKITSTLARIFFVAGVLLSVGHAAAEDGSLTTRRKDSSAVPGRKGGNSGPDAPEVESGRRALEDTVQIVGVSEQKPEADGRRKVIVKVRYALVTYPKGILALGFNLKSATRFVLVAQQEVMRGVDDFELSATIVPVTWPDAQPFKLSVSLTAEPRPKEFSLLAAVSRVLKASPPPTASAPSAAAH